MDNQALTDENTLWLSDIEVIVVGYRSRCLIEGMLRRWPPQLSVALIDNSNNEDGTAELATAFTNLRYVVGGGQGYARAANVGAFSSAKRYVLFVNPDSTPTVEDLLSLVRGLAADSSAVSHAPVTTTNNEVELGVGGWEPNVARTVVHALGLHKIWRSAGLYAKPKLGQPLQVDWTTGDCMVVEKGQFEALGGFDETFYLYMEDVSFGRRARLARLRTVLREDVTIAHAASSSGAPMLDMLRLRGAAFSHYVLRYNAPLRAHAMRWILAFGYVLRAVQRAALGHHEESKLFIACVQGIITSRAEVDGVEVAHSRYLEAERAFL